MQELSFVFHKLQEQEVITSQAPELMFSHSTSLRQTPPTTTIIPQRVITIHTQDSLGQSREIILWKQKTMVVDKPSEQEAEADNIISTATVIRRMFLNDSKVKKFL